ncbi:MAG: DUF1919 domain-containing protein [Selenomonadaceae bacterium]|nr:DUF1919 domain-containing protein [Selenomonadaceae bacterium]
MHYCNEAEAREQWYRRLKRLNWDNMFILLTDRDGCTSAVLERFDKLPYPKAVLVHKPYPHIASAKYIRGFETENMVGNCMEFRNRFTWHRYYDDFDYVAWFNGR